MAGKKIDKKTLSRASGGNTAAESATLKNAKAIVKEELKKEALAKAQGAGFGYNQVSPSGRLRPVQMSPKTGSVDGSSATLPICTGSPEPDA